MMARRVAVEPVFRLSDDAEIGSGLVRGRIEHNELVGD